jgi:hypothetical protein
VALAASGRRGRRAALALAAVPALVEWRTRRPRLDPLRWIAACLADDLAYGAGVWRGALAGRTAGPLLPRRTLRRGDASAGGGRRGGGVRNQTPQK